MAWTRSSNQDPAVDHRGWPKNKLRQYSAREEQQVLRIHRELQKDPLQFFAGASAIAQTYRARYPSDHQPSLRFIGRTLAKYGVAQSPKVRRKGVSRYLHYPEYSLNRLGKSLLEIDFIGKKFITGRTEPVNFLAFSLRYPRKLKYFHRVESESSPVVIKQCQEFFRRFEKPTVVKIDNSLSFAGSTPWPRVLGSVVMFLLHQRVIPVFTAPRKPWNQASVEGANSIFTRKFWRRFTFTSLDQIDTKLQHFNEAYARYLDYKAPRFTSSRRGPFIPKVYFIRKVYEDPEAGAGYIDVVKEHIPLPPSYVNLFVLAQWNLKTETLTVYFENEHKLKIINRASMKLNKTFKQRVY